MFKKEGGVKTYTYFQKQPRKYGESGKVEDGFTRLYVDGQKIESLPRRK